MTNTQFHALIEYIDAAIKCETSGPYGLHESVDKHKKHDKLYELLVLSDSNNHEE